MRAADLVGTWWLEAYRSIGDDGGVHEGPLGADPRGLLFYAADGHMSVTMMRSPGTGSGFMGYAGTWELSGRQVIHRVLVSSHDYLVGTRQHRDAELAGDRLTLHAVAPAASGRAGRRLLRWRRMTGVGR
ncbi:lipocalin-like domain-containing protein [Nocardia sp. XZ_19_369]|uniref:lipocalin-like domain-containing protein n=1 Tax=Nocardia sp. XZ_19_369 TaxID=2769487 RepID=UPI00189062EF|nr:lipocalin-like domain-containing protein [Nocardia sp. XZ_19_369]